jgi:hypothetical protein
MACKSHDCDDYKEYSIWLKGVYIAVEPGNCRFCRRAYGDRHSSKRMRKGDD